jgi:hypothetical protein
VARIVLYMSMTLDGFIAGPDDDLDQPLGHGGERLHRWLRDGGVRAEQIVPMAVSGHGLYKGKWVKAGLSILEDAVHAKSAVQVAE